MDNKEIEDLYRKYGPMVIRRCRTMLHDNETAMDAAHDVFIQLLRKSSRLNTGAPSSLLYTIATNVCLNKLRSLRRRGGIHGELNEEMVNSQDNSHELILTNHFLESLFSTHDTTTRLIAVYHYVDGFTLEETAAMVGMSVSGIRKRLRKLRHHGLAMREV